MQPDCVCKARFFSKNVLISAKKMCRFQAIFAVFHRLSEDFQQCFPQFVERRKSPEISEIFLGVGNLSQPVFHENPIFCFNSFNMRIFKKIFAVRFSSSFPQNFQQVFLFNSTIFQLFKMSNVDSTFQHKFNNCTVKKKNQWIRHFSDFSTVSTAPTTTTNFFNLSILSKRHTQNSKYHRNCGNFPQFLDETDRNRDSNHPFQ